VVDAFTLWLARRKQPSPWQPGDDIAVQAGRGVERARTGPAQSPDADPVDVTLIHADTGQALSGPLHCPRPLILGRWDDTFGPLTHAALGIPLPAPLILEEPT
jgi:hypothetical protein